MEDNPLTYCRTCFFTGAEIKSKIDSRRQDILRMITNNRFSNESSESRICMKCDWILMKIEKFAEQCLRVESILQKRAFSTEYLEEIAENSPLSNTLSSTSVLCIDFTDERDIKPCITYTHAPRIDNIKIETEIKSEYHHFEGDSDGSLNDEPLSSLLYHKCDGIEPIRKQEWATNRPKKIRKEKMKKKMGVERRKYVRKTSETKLIDQYKLPFTEEAMQMEHIRRMKEPEFLGADFKCDLCALIFKSELTMNGHMNLHQKKEESHICSICTLQFSTALRLEDHLKHRHSFRSTCECGANMHHIRSMTAHLEMHEGIVHSCHICKKRLKNKKSLQNHISLHNARLKCKYCNKAYPTQSQLNYHERKHKEPRHSCETCQKKFAYKHTLTQHMRVHSDVKKYYCVECDAHFKTEDILKTHLDKAAKHIDPAKLQYACEHCPKRFVNEDLLKSHVDLIHLKTRRFICEVCSASYGSEGGYKRHRREEHLGMKRELTRRHECETCGKLFLTPVALRQHLRVHTGERPFECSECESRFAQKSTLLTHIKLVHLKIKRGK